MSINANGLSIIADRERRVGCLLKTLTREQQPELKNKQKVRGSTLLQTEDLLLARLCHICMYINRHVDFLCWFNFIFVCWSYCFCQFRSEIAIYVAYCQCYSGWMLRHLRVVCAMKVCIAILGLTRYNEAKTYFSTLLLNDENENIYFYHLPLFVVFSFALYRALALSLHTFIDILHRPLHHNVPVQHFM